jgi:ribosomal protein S18 acetylase RimI-like enzyme
VYIGLARPLRGRGIGTELLKLALSRAADCNCARLTTAVDSKNSPALSLYRRAQMSTMGTRSAYVRVIHPAHSR